MEFKKNIKLVLVVFINIGLFSCLPNLAKGEKAVEKMSPDEKIFLEEKILKITPDMSENEVSKILGPVYRGTETDRPVWLAIGNDNKSQVAVYYYENKIFKIRWLKLGSFVWEKNFRSL
ncbi:MAG: hypothetical protein OEV78_06565 [Spirochaetia bacterium]|nr:hypothetical protein [Spirochaetia bacterium]